MIVLYRQAIYIFFGGVLVIEVWKNIPDYEGFYQVSNFGRVKSIKRIIIRKNGTKYFCPEKLIKYVTNKGYKYLCLCKNGKVKRFGVHQLVLRAFVGVQEKGMEVRHLDNNPSNNKLENLAYGTKSDNMQDAVRCGSLSRCHTNLTDEQVIAILSDNRRICEIAKFYNINNGTVVAIKQRKYFKHLKDYPVSYHKRTNKHFSTEDFNFILDTRNKRKDIAKKLGISFHQVKRIRKAKKNIYR